MDEPGVYRNQKESQCAWEGCGLRWGVQDGGEWGRIMKGSVGNAKNLGFYSEHTRNPWRALNGRVTWPEEVSWGCYKESRLSGARVETGRPVRKLLWWFTWEITMAWTTEVRTATQTLLQAGISLTFWYSLSAVLLVNLLYFWI